MVGAEAILPQSGLEAAVAKTLNRVRRARQKAASFTRETPVLVEDTV